MFLASSDRSTILKKREAYRRAFQGFDPAKVATYGDKEVSHAGISHHSRHPAAGSFA